MDRVIDYLICIQKDYKKQIMNKKIDFFYYPIYNAGYCEMTIGVV
jgi:hypothetical protein